VSTSCAWPNYTGNYCLQDFVREQDSTLRSLSLKDFAVVVFQNCPELRTYLVRSPATWLLCLLWAVICTPSALLHITVVLLLHTRITRQGRI
jgi:hypothetical protein